VGEDFIEKQHRQFRRLRDVAFEEYLCAQNLFSDIPPEAGLQAVGFSLNGLTLGVGQKLWQVGVIDSPEKVTLYRGMDPAIELIGEAARLAVEAANGVIAAEVTATSPDEGLVTVRFLGNAGDGSWSTL